MGVKEFWKKIPFWLKGLLMLITLIVSIILLFRATCVDSDEQCRGRPEGTFCEVGKWCDVFGRVCGGQSCVGHGTGKCFQGDRCLDHQEYESLKSLGLTPEEFKEVETKAYKALIKDRPFYKWIEKPERWLDYTKIEDFEEFKRQYNLKDLEIKPDSKIIRVENTQIQYPFYVIYLIKESEVKELVEELHSCDEIRDEIWKRKCIEDYEKEK